LARGLEHPRHCQAAPSLEMRVALMQETTITVIIYSNEPTIHKGKVLKHL
jgi:hypothetical protein